MATILETQKLVYPPLSISAVSTDVGLWIRYFGSQKYADVEVSADGDIILSHGADVGSKVADSGVGVDGVFDLSSPTVYTNYGLLVDAINNSTNWRAGLGSVRRADLTNNTLITRSATQCNLSAVGLLRDTTVPVQSLTFTIGVRVTPKILGGPGDGGWINRITKISGVVTFTAAGTSGYDDGEGPLSGVLVVVYSMNDVLKTQRRVWKSPALTSATAFSFTSDDFYGAAVGAGGLQDLSGDPGEALVVLVQNSGTGAVSFTSPSLTVHGYREAYGGAGRTELYRESNV